MKQISILGATALLCACDPAYGPRLINSYGTAVTVTVAYSNGEMTTTIWPACLNPFIGKPGVQVDKVSFEKDGKVLREFDADEIHRMVEKENATPGYFAWSVGPERSSLVDEAKMPCALGN
jgi:hypothetical protein